MSEMIERGSRALLGAMNQEPVADEQWAQAMSQTADMETLFGWVRAVIEAMMEPTDMMVSLGILQAGDCTDDWSASASCIAEHVWRAMIVEALTETKTHDQGEG